MLLLCCSGELCDCRSPSGVSCSPASKLQTVSWFSLSSENISDLIALCGTGSAMHGKAENDVRDLEVRRTKTTYEQSVKTNLTLATFAELYVKYAFY